MTANRTPSTVASHQETLLPLPVRLDLVLCTMQLGKQPCMTGLSLLQLSFIALPGNKLTGTLPDAWGTLSKVSTHVLAIQPICS